MPTSPVRRAHLFLLAICAAFAVAVPLLVPPTLALGWDEIVYVSRYDTHGPAAFFSAPRSRGVPLLVAPVAVFTDSVVLLRGYLIVAAALAMYLAHRPWLRVLDRPYAVPLAAAGYGSLWIVVFYAGAAMPNHYVAMAALGATGCFLLAAGPGRPRAPLYGLAAALAVAALMRPNDAAWIALPLLLAGVFVRAWRRLPLAVAVVGGCAAGALPWVVEAQLRFGGLWARLRRASEIQGGTHPTFSLPEHAAALDGPLLCRPCDGNGILWPAVAWWVVLSALVALGVSTARRAGRSATVWLPIAVAASTAATYLLLIDYAAPRFLLPAYALLMVPGALGATALGATAPAGRGLRLTAVALAVALVGHLTLQAALAHRHGQVQARARADWERVTAVLRDHGVRPPCRVAGTDAIPVGHAAGCRSAGTAGNNVNITVEELLDSARTTPTAMVLRGGEQGPRWVRDWPRYPVPDTYRGDWQIAVPPWSSLSR